MDYEQEVRRASGGDVKAFVDLTRQFQHMAFGAALALVHDFHQAEDVVQKAGRCRSARSRGRCRERSEGTQFPADTDVAG
jgi:DNA-directed RNA polymerase specialized sigma24 family protein